MSLFRAPSQQRGLAVVMNDLRFGFEYQLPSRIYDPKAQLDILAIKMELFIEPADRINDLSS